MPSNSQHTKCYPSEEPALRRRLKNTACKPDGTGSPEQGRTGRLAPGLWESSQRHRGGDSKGSAHTEMVKSQQLSALSGDSGFSLRLSFLSAKWVNNPELPGQLLDSDKTVPRESRHSLSNLLPSNSRGRWGFLLVFGAG